MSGYIGTQPVPQATQTRDVFTATSGQTTFATSGYTPNFLDVWLNGVKLVNGDDFTATNGSDVVLTSGAAAGDTVEVLSYSTYEVNAQTYTGGLTVSQSASGAGGWNEALVLKGTYPMLNLHETTTDKYSRIGNDGDGSIQFFVNGTSGTVGSNAAGIDPSGNLTLSGGVYLGGTGAANLLDDYEEGTWTPTINGGTLTISSTVHAQYTKIGSFVHIQAYLRFDTQNGNTTQLNIGGLPFTAMPDGYAVFNVNKGATGGSELSNPILRVAGGSTTLLGYYNFKQTLMQQNQMHGDHFIFSGTYKTTS